MSTSKAKVKGEAEDGDAVMAVHSPSGLNIRFGRRRCISSGQGDSPDGTKALVHEASRKWRCVSVLDASGQPDFSGWVHGDWLVLA